MPVWWGCFAYSMIVSIIGMFMYKSKKQSASLVPVEGKTAENYKNIGLFFALLTFTLLVFFVGNRSSIHDTQEYQYHYNLFYTDDLNQINDIINGTIKTVKGPIFYIYLVLFKHFTHGTVNDWLFSIAIFQALSVAVFLYKYSINYTYSVFLFYMSSGFLWMVNGMRQYVAVCLVLWFTGWLVKRKTIPFLIVVIIACLIHSASLLWIPVYFIVNYDTWSKKYMVGLFVFSIGLIIYSRSSLVNSTEFAYLSKDVNEGINPLRFIVSAVPAIIAFIKREEIKKIENDYDKIFINLSILSAAGYFVGLFTNGVVARVSAYFNPFVYLSLPWLLKKSFDESLGKSITIISLIAYFMYFCYEMYGAHNGVYASDVLGLQFWNV
jgi:transmembrane protein EpsG